MATGRNVGAVVRAPQYEQDWLLDAALAPDADGDVLAPLYRGAADGVLVLPFCVACGLPLELEQEVCDGCAAPDPSWQAVQPLGTVHSVTMVHRLEPDLVRTTEPYPVADIELATGHRLIMTALLPGTEAPPIGTPVAVGFRHVGDVAVPAFTPVDDSRTDFAGHSVPTTSETEDP